MASPVSKTLTFQIILSSATNRKQQQSHLPKNSSRVLTFSSSSLYSAIHGVAPTWLQDVNPWFSISMQPITSSTLTFKENFFVVKTDNLPLRDDDKFQCRWRLGGTAADIEDEPKQKKRDVKRKSWNMLHPNVYTVIVGASFCVALALCSFTLPSKVRASRYVVVPYSDLLSAIRDGSVDRVQFVEDSSQIFFNKKSLGDPSAETSQGNSLTSMEGKPRWQYATRNVDDDKHDLLVMLDEMGITYGADPGLLSASTKDMLFVLFQLAPCWILVFLTFYQISSQLSVGKSNAKKLSEKPSVTFSDVEGVDAAKAELLEIVLCMKGESKYTKLGAKVPKGVLLAGPPGTGKTLLARAIAGEAGVSFFSISASELVEIFVGMGAARVRDLFHEARKHSPSIVFIDEIDAVGKHRGGSSNAEYDQTLNQLLTEMDGFEKDSNVVVIAATNRPEMLDAALLRPGRFSRKVQVEEPDNDGRRKIFGIYLRNIITEEDKDELCELVAGLTPGLVGADLENIASEAVLLAARRGDDCVKREDFVLACERANTKLHSYSSKQPYQPRMDSGVASGYVMF